MLIEIDDYQFLEFCVVDKESGDLIAHAKYLKDLLPKIEHLEKGSYFFHKCDPETFINQKEFWKQKNLQSPEGISDLSA